MRESRVNWCQWLAVVLTALFFVSATPGSAHAQVDTGTIAGMITDGTGATLPGVTVTVTNLATGRERTAVTNPAGLYRISALQPSKYSLTAELPGFTKVTRPEVTVNVGSTVDINLTLQLAAVQETVTVSAEAPLIESTQTALSGVISREQLETLPSKNRSYLDFSLLLPAATESTTQQGTGLVLGAARSKEGTLLVDGFYNLDEVFTMPKVRHSQDAIQEFQVISFGGAAEFGRAIGGTVNAITRSGGNEFEGTGYGFFREKALNAQDFGEKALGLPKSDFTRRQFGGSLGGPLKENKSFFFVAAERTTEDIPFNNGIKPPDAAIIGLPSEDVGVIPRIFRQNFVMVKWDHNLNNNHHLQASYSYSTQWDYLWSTVEPLTTRSAVSSNLHFWDHALLGKWTAIASGGRVLHELKGSYIPRSYRPGGYSKGGPPLVRDGEINIGNMDNGSPPRVTIANVATFGSQGFQGDTATYPTQVIYTTSLFADKHEIKTGIDYLYTDLEWIFYSTYLGRYNFSSLPNFLAGRYSQYTQTFGDASNPRTHQYISGFAQDTWRANTRLTVNYGLRYDLELNPEHKKSGTPFGNDYNNFGPRLGLSYDLTGKGKTFAKMSSGVFYDRLWQNMTGFFTGLKDHEQTVAATWTPTTSGAPLYPNVFSLLPADVPRSAVNVSIMPDEVKIPTSAQVIGTLEHLLGNNLALAGSVIYNRSWYKEYTYDTNLAWDGQRWIRPDPNYRSINQLRFEGPAQYLGGFVSVTKRGARYGYEGNVTVARANATPLASSGIQGTINDQREGIMADYGPDPNVARVRGLVSAWCNILSNLQVSGIFRARTGLAVDPRADGLDVNGDFKFGDRTPGLKPHSFRGPDYSNLDTRLTWALPYQQNGKVLIYFEAFNLLNTRNVKTLLTNYGADPANPNPRWLEPASYFPPREIQLGARLNF